MAKLRKVITGERFNVGSSTWNAFIDAALAHQRNRLRQDREVADHDTDTGVILVYNDSGSDVPIYGVLGLTTPVLSPDTGAGGSAGNLPGFKERLALNGTTPAATHAGKFCITIEPIPIGKIGRAVVQGVTIAKIDVASGTPTAADIKVGSLTLLSPSSTGAAQVLWLESGTGEKWALVRLGGVARGMIPVKVTKVGGAAGPPSTWTYDVTTLSGTSLGTAMTPKLRRPASVATTFPTAGTVGTGYYDENGDFQLFDANESC